MLTYAERTVQIRRVLAFILVANWVVALAKLGFGISSRLASVTADGLHSFIDGGSNVLGLVAMSVAARPADDDHPYGHGKFEAIASLGIGAMVGIAMLELGRMAFDALVHDRHPEVEPALLYVLIATLAVNLVVTRVERSYGLKLNSPLLLADARHTLSDVFVSLAVIASVLLVSLQVPRADGVVALVVMVVVAYVAWGIVRQSIGILSDTARLDPARVEALATGIPGVRRCWRVRSRGMEGSVWVDLKIEVDPQMTTAEAHALADELEDRLMSEFNQIVDVVVHVEPAGDRPAFSVHEGSRR
jgi:cation diffusion facilitator family transporter